MNFRVLISNFVFRYSFYEHVIYMCSYREVFPYSPMAGLVNIDVNPDSLESPSAQSLQ